MNSQKIEIIRPENCYVSEEESHISLENECYYYGYISRETAEWLLWEEGCNDGLYLLRNSGNDYVLSLCHQKSVLHYRISKLKSGEYFLQGLPQNKFGSVMSLIACCNGLVCKPSRPMQASVGQCLPPTHWGLTIEKVRDYILQRAEEWGLTAPQLNIQLDSDLHWTGIASPVLKCLVVSTLHEIQPWFHERLSRIEAERRIQISGHKDGKFLVRDRDDSSYAICLSFESTAKHYRIDILPSGNFCIQDGPQFQSIIALVSHYTIWSSGLYCALSEPCRRPQALIKDFVQQSDQTFKTTGRQRIRSLSMERTRNALNRTVRATTPTNIRIKEWFATINHKFNRIKKQTQEVLQNNRHHPLIQDHYDYSGDISSLLTLRRHQCCQQSSNQRLSNNLIGRSHEEPVFGSGNIFDLNNDCLPQKTSHIRHTQNTNNSNHISDQSIDFLHKSHQRLVRSSSIDTIQALISEPSIETIHIMHSIEQPLTPPVPAPRKTVQRPTNSSVAKVYVNQDVLQRTQSLDCSHCSHCSECLIDLNQSTDDFDQLLDHFHKCLQPRNSSDDQNRNKQFDRKTSLQSMSGQSVDLLTGNDTSKLKATSPLTANTCAQELAEIFSNPLIDGKDPNQSISCDLLSDKNTNSLSSVGLKTISSEKSAGSSDSNTTAAEKRTDSTATDPIVINRSTDNKICDQRNDTITNDMTIEPNISSNIDLLKEFDICFNNSDNNQNNNIVTDSTALSSNGTYESYDSIELQDESIVKKASIGVADLNNADSISSTSSIPIKQYDLICLSEEPEEVLQSLSKCKRGPLCLDSKCITIKRRIGNGYFGDVYLATIPCTTSSAVIQLAVKMLKTNASQQQKADFLREAQVMSKLMHKHIVRLIGVCCGDPFMLCMELAPLGPLNRYLALDAGHHMTTDQLLVLMLQVAKAMNYLSSQYFVHRDLAARNVLLVNEQLAKVSDFGMSRAVEPKHDYYRATRASKWPLKWYAPECIYYYKFTHKSDVWSYGITLWEVMARGQMPYQGMDGQDILRTIKDNKRLTKPDNCPVIIYQLMWNCWQFKPEDRPTFQQICDRLESYLAGAQGAPVKH